MTRRRHPAYPGVDDYEPQLPSSLPEGLKHSQAALAVRIKTPKTTPDVIDRAQAVVASMSGSAEEADELLRMLGIHPSKISIPVTEEKS